MALKVGHFRRFFKNFTPNRAILRQAGWVAGGQVLSALGALATIRIMTELLTPEEFGRLTLLVGLAALALGLAANPRLQALIRYYPEAAREGQVRVLRAVVIRLTAPLVAISAAALACFWIVAGHWLGDAWFTGLLVAALLVVDCLRSLELSLLNAARRQRSAAPIYIADAWSRPLLAIVCVMLFGSSANAALTGYIAGSAAVIVVMHLVMRLEGVGERDAAKYVEIWRKSDEMVRSVKRYAGPLAPLAIFGWLSGMGDRYVIAGMLNLHDAGLYAAAYGLASRPFLMLSGVVELTMRPVLQNAVAVQDYSLIKRTKKLWILAVAAGAGSGVVCFMLLSEWVGRLLLGEQFRVATALMPWIALGYAIYCVATVYTRFCYAFDATKAVLALTAVGAVVGIAVLFPAIAIFALPGAAAAVLVRFGIEFVIAAFLARRAERDYLMT